MNYKISIIVIVFNVEKYLEEALESILRQSIGIQHLEVLMVNDCSTDNSGKIMDHYADKYENFKSIHLPENSGGCGKPRNVGMDHATGEYIMFLDSDDYYTDDACEVLYNTVKKEDADIAFSKYIVFSGNDKQGVIYKSFKDIEEVKVQKIEEYPELLTLAPSVWTKIYRRTFIEKNNFRFSVGILAEDFVFVVKTFLKAKGIVFLNNHYCYYYRVRKTEGDESLSNDKSSKNLRGMLNGYFEVSELLKENNKIEYLSQTLFGHLEYWAEGFIKSNASPEEKKEILEHAYPLFKELDNYPVKPWKEHLILFFNNVSQKRFDDTIILSEMINNYTKIINDCNRNQQKLQKHNLELKKRIATIQTIKGYGNYKTKNIVSRIKKKMDL